MPEASPEAVEWAQRVAGLYEQQLYVEKRPWPPKMDGDLLMEMPVDGEAALAQAGFLLDLTCVWMSPVPHQGLGIVRK